MRTTIMCLVLGVVPFGCLTARAEEEDTTKSDKELIRGTWKVKTMRDSGRDPPDQFKNLTVVIDDQTIVLRSGENAVWKLTYKLDPAKKPKWIDLTLRNEKRPQRGIYEIKDRTLRICVNENLVGERSTRFESKPDSPNDLLIVCERERP